jgi:hypothetical protein
VRTYWRQSRRRTSESVAADVGRTFEPADVPETCYVTQSVTGGATALRERNVAHELVMSDAGH